MSAQTIEELQQAERRLVEEISERQALIDAYRKVREDLLRLNGSPNGTRASDHPDLPLNPHTESLVKDDAYGGTTRLIRSAISHMPVDYTIRDIRGYLLSRGYRTGMNSIATVLMRLKKRGEIKVLHPGRGRKPAVFKKVT